MLIGGRKNEVDFKRSQSQKAGVENNYTEIEQKNSNSELPSSQV